RSKRSTDRLLRRLNKPEYFFRPSQLLRRLHQVVRSIGGSHEVNFPWGAHISIDPREEIGRAILRKGLYDLIVSETLWRLVEPGDLAVDVGANIGAMTSLMARRCGPNGMVASFEPHPRNFRALERNAARWRSHEMAALILHQMALSSFN